MMELYSTTSGRDRKVESLRVGMGVGDMQDLKCWKLHGNYTYHNHPSSKSGAPFRTLSRNTSLKETLWSLGVSTALKTHPQKNQNYQVQWVAERLAVLLRN